MNLDISRICVLIRKGGTDIINIYTSLPSSFPPGLSSDNLVLRFESQKGKGVEYVRKNFNIEPSIINID